MYLRRPDAPSLEEHAELVSAFAEIDAALGRVGRLFHRMPPDAEAAVGYRVIVAELLRVKSDLETRLHDRLANGSGGQARVAADDIGEPYYGNARGLGEDARRFVERYGKGRGTKG